MSNVTLFSELVKTYGPDPTEQQLRLFLQQTAAVDLPKITKTTADVSQKLKDNRAYLAHAKVGGKTETEHANQKNPNAPDYQAGGGMGIMQAGQAGMIQIVPADGKPFAFPLDNIKLARSLVNAVFDEMEKRPVHSADKKQEKE